MELGPQTKTKREYSCVTHGFGDSVVISGGQDPDSYEVLDSVELYDQAMNFNSNLPSLRTPNLPIPDLPNTHAARARGRSLTRAGAQRKSMNLTRAFGCMSCDCCDSDGVESSIGEIDDVGGPADMDTINGKTGILVSKFPATAIDDFSISRIDMRQR